MLIKASTARHLISTGKAGNTSLVWADGVDHTLTEPTYVTFDNYGAQRTDRFTPDAQAILEWMRAK